MRPFFSIWIKPPETFKFLGERNLAGKKNYIDYLFALISLSLCLTQIDDFKSTKIYTLLMNAELPDPLRFFLTVAFLLIVGFLSFKYVNPYFIWRLGKIFKGKATLAEIRLVLAYSAIPNLIYLVIALIFLIPALKIGNINLILHQYPITFFVIWLFTTRNLIFGLSYFNKYSYLYAILNIVILGAIFEAISLLIKH